MKATPVTPEELERMVSIINAPTADKPFGKTYTVRYLGNVVGGKEGRHLNLSTEDFKAAILRQLEAGKVVWFDRYVYQAAVEREYLGGQAKLIEQEPVMLEAWDPMGTLAD